MHIVKCLYCQEQFDRDEIKCQKIGRRYAHLTCHEPKIDVNGPTYNMILQYARQILGEQTNFLKVSKQIKEFVTTGYSYKGIYLTLKYWYEVKNNSTEKAMGGIGIVPYVYKEAADYWKSCQPTRIPKMEEETIVITYKKKKRLVDVLLEEG